MRVAAAKDGVTSAPALPNQKLVDTASAGDLFAAALGEGLCDRSWQHRPNH
jgi:sugar/nucleoside kinase (ribokinase family)